MTLVPGAIPRGRGCVLAAGVLGVGLVALGCGAPPPEVTVAMTEFAFDPNRLAIQRAEKTIIRLENRGTVEHNFAVPQLNVASANVAPGKTATLEISVPRGPLRIVCTVPGHEEAGMVGEIAVEQRRR